MDGTVQENSVLEPKRHWLLLRLMALRRQFSNQKEPVHGCGQVYDGTFSGKLTEGHGITARLLMDYQIEVFTENNKDV